MEKWKIGMDMNLEEKKDSKKMASYICDWIGKEGRNDLGSLTW